MKATANVKCNFESVFAQFDSVEMLREIANNICAQVKEAYDNRVAQLKPSVPEVTVQVEVEPKATKNKSTKAKAEKAPTQKKSDTKKESPAKSKSSDTVQLSLKDGAELKKLKLTFSKYNDKCWVLRGDTKPIKDTICENFKGVYNSNLRDGGGIIVRTTRAQECADALGLKVKVS